VAIGGHRTKHPLHTTYVQLGGLLNIFVTLTFVPKRVGSAVLCLTHGHAQLFIYSEVHNIKMGLAKSPGGNRPWGRPMLRINANGSDSDWASTQTRPFVLLPRYAGHISQRKLKSASVSETMDRKMGRREYCKDIC
jgi:hypothetical protein